MLRWDLLSSAAFGRPRTWAAVLVAAFACLLTACSGGQTGSENVQWGCLPVETTTVSLDEVTPLGFSAADVLAFVEGERELGLVYEGDDETTLTLAVEAEGDTAVFEEREWRSDGSMTLEAPAMECGDALVIPVAVDFASADGRFAERWSVNLQAEQATHAQLNVRLEPDELEGSLDVASFATEDFDTLGLWVDMAFDSTHVSGEITGTGETYHGDAVSHTTFPIADLDHVSTAD